MCSAICSCCAVYYCVDATVIDVVVAVVADVDSAWCCGAAEQHSHHKCYVRQSDAYGTNGDRKSDQGNRNSEEGTQREGKAFVQIKVKAHR